MPMPRKFAIGQRIWSFDENRRRYATDSATGRRAGSPIFAAHFEPHTVAGIEARSYLIVRGHPPEGQWNTPVKVGFDKAERAYRTDDERDAQIWVEDHRWKVVEAVRRADVATLKRVAAVVGYAPSRGEEDV